MIVLDLAPVFAIILLGALMHRSRLIPDSFWPAAEQLTFYLLFPALLLVSTAGADFSGHRLLPMAGALVIAIVIVATLAWAAGATRRLGGPIRSSLIQGAIRPNVYLALGTAAAVAGADGLAAASLCTAVAVPLVNLISVAALIHYRPAPAAAVGTVPVLVAIARNPLIIACLLGLGLNGLGWPMPPVLGPLLTLLGQAALPLGLLAVGAGLDLTAVRSAGALVAATCGLKLVLLPLLTFALCAGFGVTGPPKLIATLFAGLPIAGSAYVMARQMAGDAVFLAAAITASTLAAALTLPLLIAAVL